MTESRDYLIRQHEIAWALASYHLEGLTTDECLWRPARAGLHVNRAPDGMWLADWPDHEGYDLGPPSIAWITWHICFWWSTVLDHSFGAATLAREDISWPESAEAVRDEIGRLQREWRAQLDSLNDEDLHSTSRTRWPLQDKPFGDIVAWVNIELTKNAAELGYARFLYAVRSV